MLFERPLVRRVASALERMPLLHVIVGPRQVGKSTAATQVADHLGWPRHVATADAAIPHSPEWIEAQWRIARARAKESRRRVLLVLDEIQKVPGWSEVVKRLWDEERQTGGTVRVLLLGSSALLVQRGLTESLAGRFYLHQCAHWTWTECREAFGWTLDQWLFFGGYPGTAPLVGNQQEWKHYVADSLIETVLARDVLQMSNIAKPALLRHLFALASQHPAQILSYNKMLGQLTDAGNTTTLASYLRTLETAFLISGLEQYSKGHVRKRGSSPKLVLWNNALVNAVSPLTFNDAFADGGWWGRLVENAVVAHILNHMFAPTWHISYWRDGNDEVDFVVTHGARAWGVEVKSGRGGKTPGLAAFRKRYPKSEIMIVGTGGIALSEFFTASPDTLFS